SAVRIPRSVLRSMPTVPQSAAGSEVVGTSERVGARWSAGSARRRVVVAKLIDVGPLAEASGPPDRLRAAVQEGQAWHPARYHQRKRRSPMSRPTARP